MTRDGEAAVPLGEDGDTRHQGGAGDSAIVTRDFALLFASSFLFLGSLYMILPVLPFYMVDVARASKAQVGLLIGALTVTSMALRPYVGRKTDSLGRKPLLLAGSLNFVVASLVYPVARSVPSLALLLVFHGIGIACFHTASLTFIGDTSPAARKGQSMAWFQSSFNLAIMLAPLLGVFLMRRLGFGATFIAASASAAASALLTLMVSEARASVIPRVPPPGRAAGARKLIALAGAAVFAGTVTLGSVEAFIGLFAESREIENFALFFTVSAGVIITLRFSAGRLPDALGSRKTMSLALLALSGSMVILAASGGFALMCLSAVIYGVGFAFLSPAASALLVERIPGSELGGAFGLYTAAFEGGIAFGAIAMGPAVSMLGFGPSFLVLSAIPLLGSLFVAACYRLMVEERQ